MQPLRFATAGSVDDGKSTLIGRLLFDARAVQEDQLAAVERASQRRGAAQIDLSLLTDGLEAEREQGITIDVAYRYFATPRRKFIIADGPGHVQYTRNMATGASNADALVLLLDVKEGLKEQTKKHLRIARLLGIRQVVAFLNKMDLVGWSRGAFDAAATDLRAFAALLDLETLDLIPGSALEGDMVVERGPFGETRLGWYRGPTLLERLETLHASTESAAAGPFRFPVQLVSRPQASAGNSAPRGYMGRIESGHVLAGTEVVLLPSGRRSRVRQILTHGTSRELAVAGDSVTLVLADDIDVARGDLIADTANPPREARALEVTLVWLGHEALRPGGRYLVQQGSRRVLTKVQADAPLALNDIGEARLTLNAPLFVDPYDTVRTTGSLILIDEATNHTVAAGLVK
jgi:sulfate adenylyltransferase large subunit